MKTSRSASSGARRRPPEQPASEAARPEEEILDQAADAPRYQTFKVRFLVDPQAVCRRTEVTYVQTQEGDAWPGYAQEHLIKWIADRVQPGGQDQELQPAAERPVVASSLLLRDLCVAPPDGASEHLVAAGEPFKLRLTLQLDGEAVRAAPVGYAMSAVAKGFDAEDQPIGEARGQAALGEAVPLELTGVIARPGLYRLAVQAAADPPARCAATLLGELVQVYGGADR